MIAWPPRSTRTRSIVPQTAKNDRPAAPAAADSPGERRTHYRWLICGLLFFATTLIYVERQVFGILKPSLMEQFHWREIHYSFIVSAFTLAYAVSYTASGKMMDWIGERKGFILTIGAWSTVAMAYGLINPLVYSGLPWLNAVFAGTFLGSLTPTIVSVAGFSVIRFALGLAEGGNFPGAIKTVGLWHPKRERAMAHRTVQQRQQCGRHHRRLCRAVRGRQDAMGLARRVLLDRRVGLRVAHVLAASVRSSRAASARFARRIGLHSQRSARSARPYLLVQLAPTPPDVGLYVGMFLASPVWWFYVVLDARSFLAEQPSASTWTDVSGRCWWSTLMADAGSIVGGGLSSWLIRRGASVNVARKTTFLVCALAPSRSCRRRG